MAATRIRIGTRKSAMALAQTEEIARRLTAAVPDIDVEIVKFETSGDADQTGKLLPHGGKGGAFVAEIRQAVIAGQLHAAMHSLKDMPGNEDTPGLVIGATLSRDPPGDVLVLRPGVSVDDIRRSLGRGFKLGTNAVRRAAYTRRLFPEIEVIHYRGAADTRVRKLDNSEMQRRPGSSAVGPADASALGWLTGSPMSSRSAKCCRRSGRALSLLNVASRIGRPDTSCRASMIPPHIEAPMPSARSCGSSTAIAIRRSRDFQRSRVPRCR